MCGVIELKFETKYRIEDYIGKEIYYLKPVKEVEQRAKDSSKQWEFECVCGKHIITTPSRVISGHNKSCGCMKYKNMKSGPRDKGNRSRINPDEYIGKKNNMLTVIGYTNPLEKGRVKLRCLCDCGKETFVFPYQFSKGSVQSCGCLKEHIWNGKRDLPWMVKHGLSGDRLYKKFLKMKNRCYNKNNDHYYNYGGRGIYICDEWLNDPSKFVDWAIEHGGLDESLTIDRIDGDGPYSPENCRFATSKEQQRNIRTNRIIEYNGEKHCVAEWAEILGVNYRLISSRLNNGWDEIRALTEPLHIEKRHKIVTPNSTQDF